MYVQSPLIFVVPRTDMIAEIPKSRCSVSLVRDSSTRAEVCLRNTSEGVELVIREVRTCMSRMSASTLDLESVKDCVLKRKKP